MTTMNLKTGDEVIVTTGSSKGKRGKITQVLPKVNKIVVEGVALRTRHLKSKKPGEAGQKVAFSMPIHASNVQLLSADGKPLRHTKRAS